jgi:hypothetical protein
LLFLSKKYELREIRLENVFFKISVLALSVFLIFKFAGFNDITNLFLTTIITFVPFFIWELFGNKNNLIYTEEGLSEILTKIESKKEFEILSFFNTYNTVRKRNNKVLPDSKEYILEEIDFFIALFNSSFSEYRRAINTQDRTLELIKNWRTKKTTSDLMKDFKVNFDNLIYLYENNASYQYFYYGLGKVKQTPSKPKQKDLKIHHFFVSTPLVGIDNNKVCINRLIQPNTVTHKYAVLLYNSLTSDINIREYDDELKALIIDDYNNLYKLYVETKDNNNYFTLNLRITYDLLSKYFALLKPNNISLSDLNLSSYYDNHNDFIDNLELTISKHEITNLFYLGIFKDYNLFKDYSTEFNFKPPFFEQFYSIKQNGLSKKLIGGEIKEYINLYEEIFTNYDCQDVALHFEKLLYKVFYEYFKNNTGLDFSTLVSFFNKNKDWFFANHNYSSIRKISIINSLKEVNNLEYLINLLFKKYSWNAGIYNSLPLIQYYSFEEFARYYRDWNE